MTHLPNDPPPAHTPHPKFPPDQVGFYAELKRRTAVYFATIGRPEQGSWRMYLKTAVIFAWWAAAYSALVFLPLAWWQAIPVAVCLAIAMTAVGFAVQHDAGHGAYSRRRWVNRAAAVALDLIGASSYLWRFKHGVLHHTYPNVAGHDTDIESGGVARLSPDQPRYWYHRWQHLYLWPLYALTAPRWHLVRDFKEVIDGRIGNHPIPRPKGWDLVVFLGGKAASFALLLGIPMLVHPWWVVLLFYLFVTGTIGVVLTTVFQLAHCVEEAEFPAPDPDTLKMEAAWAVHQVETTVNFARTSRVLTWYLGGLNFQIEHHLFPRVCHLHYPALSRIVEAVCREYGVRYAVHPTFLDGVKSHYRWLRRMGRPNKPVAPALPTPSVADLAARVLPKR
jgi:linoleoyl-CoA desaturase